jgi:hypothetical protein
MGNFTYRITTDAGSYQFEAPLMGTNGDELPLYDAIEGILQQTDTIRIIKIDPIRRLVFCISLTDLPHKN